MPQSPVDPFENTIFETIRVPRGDDEEIEATRPLEPGEDPTVVLGGDGDATATAGVDASSGSAGRSGSTGSKPTETFVPTRTGSAGVDPAGEAPVPLERGNQIRQYRLDAQVGKGGQGVVWLGFDSLAHRQVALKFLPAAMARDEGAMKEMREEASVLFDLTHERIVRLNTIEQAGGYAFLVMEYLGGPSVQQVLKQRVQAGDRGLTVEECLWLLDQIADPLDYANAKGVTHRDIKPANIMLTGAVKERLGEEGVDAKICDFGIAFVTSTQMNELEGFVPIGTVPFMAPEVLDRKQPTPAADVYSLGATLYYLIQGRPPFRGQGLVDQIRNEPVPPLESGDATFDAAILRALSKDPAERPESARALLYEASGGTMGGEAHRSPWKAVLATAGIVGAVAAAAIVWIKAFTSLEADIRSPEPGTPFTAPVEMVFGVEDPSVEEAVAGVVGQDEGTYRYALRNDDGLFRISLPVPEEEGPFTVELLDAETRKSLGSRELVADHTLEASEDEVRVVGDGPFDVGEPLELRFSFREPVTVSWQGQAVAELSSGEEAVRLDVSSLPVGDRVSQEQLNLTVADRAGNRLTVPVPVPLYSRADLVARLEEEFPLADVEWDARELAALEDDLRAWETRLDTDSRLTEGDRSALRTGEPRGRLRKRLNDTLAAVQDVAIRVDPGFGVAHRQPGGAVEIYSRTKSYELTGQVENARSGVVSVSEGGREATLELDPEGRFAYPLELLAGEERRLRLVAPGYDGSQVVAVHLDEEDPEVAALRVAGEPVDLTETTPSIRVGGERVAFEATFSERVDEVGLRVGEEGAPVEATYVEGQDGGAAAVEAAFAQVDQETWRAELVLSDGWNDVSLEPVDLSGRSGPRNVRVFVDLVGPARTGSSPPAGARIVGAEERWFELELDEVLGAEPVVEALFAGEAGTEEVPVTDVSVDAAGTLARWHVRVPDEEGELTFRVRVRDELQNESRHELAWPVHFDEWGSFPVSSRHLFERVPDPEWAAQHAEWTPDVIDEGRWPRCIRHLETGMELVFVPSGSFELGGPGEPMSARMPAHGPPKRVGMSRFYIGRTEVSRRHAAPDDEEAGDVPLLLTYAEAIGWCRDRALDLPTEAQWEYAASGPENPLFPWGDSLTETAVNAFVGGRLSPPVMADVGGWPGGASWCLARQMSGNASEWCRDRLDFAAVEEGARDPVGSLIVAGTELVPITRGGMTSSRKAPLLMSHSRVPEMNTLASRGFRAVFDDLED